MATEVTPIESPEFLAEDRSMQLVATSIAYIVVTTVVLATRFCAKRFQGGGFHLDDGFLVAAYIVNLGMCALGIIMTKVGGVGRHVEFIQAERPRQLAGWAQTILAFEMIYFISIALPKLSIICLYLRIFNWKGALQRSAQLLFLLTAMNSLALFGAACFQCRPLAFWWDKTIRGGTCFDVQAFFHAQALPGAILDLAIMVLPVGTIWHLKLPLLKRIALLLVFIVASFGIVSSIIRATIFFNTTALEDRTWASVDLVGWSIIEISIYIVTGCLPHMKPLVSHYTPAWLRRFLRGTLTTIKTGSGGKSAASRYLSSKSMGTTRSKPGNGAGLGGENEDAIELTAPEEDLHRVRTNASLPESPRSSGLRPPRPTIVTSGNDRGIMSPAVPALSPGQIMVTREVRLTRT